MTFDGFWIGQLGSIWRKEINLHWKPKGVFLLSQVGVVIVTDGLSKGPWIETPPSVALKPTSSPARILGTVVEHQPLAFRTVDQLVKWHSDGWKVLKVRKSYSQVLDSRMIKAHQQLLHHGGTVTPYGVAIFRAVSTFATARFLGNSFLRAKKLVQASIYVFWLLSSKPKINNYLGKMQF